MAFEQRSPSTDPTTRQSKARPGSRYADFGICLKTVRIYEDWGGSRNRANGPPLSQSLPSRPKIYQSILHEWFRP